MHIDDVVRECVKVGMKVDCGLLTYQGSCVAIPINKIKELVDAVERKAGAKAYTAGWDDGVEYGRGYF